MRVCFVYNSFHPIYNGAAIYAQTFLTFLRRRAVDGFILTKGYPGLPREESIGNIEVIRSRPTSLRGRVGSLQSALCLFASLYSLRSEFDLVHFGDGPGCAYLPIVSRRWVGKPMVVESVLLGSDDADAIAAQVFGHAKLGVLHNVNAIFAVSERIASTFRHNHFPSDRVKLMPYAVDCSHFSPATQSEVYDLRCRLGLPRESRIAVFVGGVNSRKAVDFLVYSFSHVVTHFSDAVLLIVGPHSKARYGGYFGHVQEIIGRLGLGDRVVLTGQVDNVVDYLRAADVYVTASKSEGLSIALLEAMACGLPAVVTNLEGITDMVIGHDNGIVCPRDERFFASSILRLFANSSLREEMAQAARRRAIGDFEIQARAARVTEFYTSLIS
ncbi:MAG: glycosyltransferase family 4 protein [Acidobacteriota bacterium]